MMKFSYIKQRLRHGISFFIMFMIFLFAIDQIFFRNSSALIFVTALFVLGGILGRRFLITCKDIDWQKHLQDEVTRKNKAINFAFEKAKNTIGNLTLKMKCTHHWKNNAGSMASKADIAMREGRTLEAHKLFIQALAIDPNHLDSNYKLGLLYIEQRDSKKAEEVFRHLIQLKENESLYHGCFAFCLYLQGDYETALQHYERASALDPKNAEFFARTGEIYLKIGKKEEACRAYLQASDLDSRNFEYLELLLNYHQEKNDLQVCQQLLRKMLFLKPYNNYLKEQLRAMQRS